LKNNVNFEIPHAGVSSVVSPTVAANRMEYKEATLGFGRRRLLIFELFLGLHRKR
jgi:hypothetical protein